MKFSIIIPTYNRANLLSIAIESVIQQGYSNWELLIIDDGSIDNTKEVVKPYLNDKIKYLFQENAERGAARNNGVKNATGDYVFFLDSDDFILPGYLSEAKKLISKNSHCKLFYIPYLIGTENQFRKGPNLKNINKSIYKQNKFGCPVIVQRKIALLNKFSEDRNFTIGEDWWFILQIISKHQFAVSNKALGRVVQHQHRSMDAPKPKDLVYSKNKLISLILQHDTLKMNHVLLKSVNYEFDYLIILSKFAHKLKGKEIIVFIFRNPKVLFSKRILVIIKKTILGG